VTFDVDDTDPAIKASTRIGSGGDEQPQASKCWTKFLRTTMAKIVNGWQMKTDAGCWGLWQLLSQVGDCGYGWPGHKSTQRFHLSAQYGWQMLMANP
jgi:hypothetical protein